LGIAIQFHLEPVVRSVVRNHVHRKLHYTARFTRSLDVRVCSLSCIPSASRGQCPGNGLAPSRARAIVIEERHHRAPYRPPSCTTTPENASHAAMTFRVFRSTQPNPVRSPTPPRSRYTRLRIMQIDYLRACRKSLFIVKPPPRSVRPYTYHARARARIN